MRNNKLLINLIKELDKFWKWFGVTPEQYSKMDSNGERESLYYYIGNIYLAINNLVDFINKNKITNEEYFYPMLDALAIDSEGEIILDIYKNDLDNQERLVILGYKYYQPHARWQIAKLLGDSNIPNKEKYLLEMLNDKDKYVQRMALVSLDKINYSKINDLAFEKLKDEDEYIRLVSLAILNDHNHLTEAVEFLKNDKSELIQKEIKNICRIKYDKH